MYCNSFKQNKFDASVLFNSCVSCRCKTSSLGRSLTALKNPLVGVLYSTIEMPGFLRKSHSSLFLDIVHLWTLNTFKSVISCNWGVILIDHTPHRLKSFIFVQFSKTFWRMTSVPRYTYVDTTRHPISERTSENCCFVTFVARLHW